MEREQQPQERLGCDAEPRDGPAVLLVNARLLDEGIGLVGGWVDLDRPRPEVAEQIGEIIGSGNQTDWVVVDQIGLGGRMWNEHDVADLLGLASEHQP